MNKNLGIFCIFSLGSFTLLGMSGISERVRLRVAAFNEWKKTQPPVTKMGLKIDDPEYIASYIHLDMNFMRISEEAAKSPERLSEATQFAQQICPSYNYWHEYYQFFSKVKRGKCYSREEQVELMLGPIMPEISRLKLLIAILKGESIAEIQLIPDWKKEAAALEVQEKSLSSLALIPLAIPPKQQELERLKKEFEQLSHPSALNQVLLRASQYEPLANTLSQARSSLQEKTNALFDLAAANSAQESTIASLQVQLQDKEQEIARLKEKMAKQ